MESPATLSFTCHTSTYPAIDPKNDYLSMSGRSILITGASRSIGAATVEAFAQAGASNIILVGRSRDTLDPTAQRLRQKYEDVKLITYPLDLSKVTPDECQLLFNAITKEHGIKCVDTLALNAGIYDLNGPIPGAQFSLDGFWQSFEVNVRGNLNLVRAFISQPGLPENATIINTASALAYVRNTPFSSSYSSSKLAFLRMLDFLAYDRPSLRIFSFHPGSVRSEMLISAGVPIDSPEFIFQDVDLPANFAVWLASSKADFLNGRAIEAAWDVEEMEKAKEIILADERVFRVGLQGRGFVPMMRSQLK